MESVTVDRGDYRSHLYITHSFNTDKEQAYVNYTNKPRLVHLHEYAEPCIGNSHVVLTPNEPSQDVEILPK